MNYYCNYHYYLNCLVTLSALVELAMNYCKKRNNVENGER